MIKKKPTLFFHIFIFVMAQLAWLSLLGLWIYWFVSNQFIFNRMPDWVSTELISRTTNLISFIGGLVLLVAISFAMSLIFRNLNVQINLTRLYDNFIANVTHELKSPLASIQLYLETLDQRKVPEHQQKEFITSMRHDAERLNTLINSILDIARLEQKKIAYNFYVHQADDLIKELLQESGEQFKLKKDIITLHGEASVPIVADRNALQIVLNNLVDNAIKYTDGPLKIDVKISNTAKKVIIDVSDNGIGLTAKNQKKIFQKFHRILDSNSPAIKGSGLGLYWVKEIIHIHGGKVSVYSPGQNMGTTFTMELPIYKTSKKRHIEQLLKVTQKLRRSGIPAAKENYE